MFLAAQMMVHCTLLDIRLQTNQALPVLCHGDDNIPPFLEHLRRHNIRMCEALETHVYPQRSVGKFGGSTRTRGDSLPAPLTDFSPLEEADFSAGVASHQPKCLASDVLIPEKRCLGERQNCCHLNGAREWKVSTDLKTFILAAGSRFRDEDSFVSATATECLPISTPSMEFNEDKSALVNQSIPEKISSPYDRQRELFAAIYAVHVVCMRTLLEAYVHLVCHSVDILRKCLSSSGRNLCQSLFSLDDLELPGGDSIPVSALVPDFCKSGMCGGVKINASRSSSAFPPSHFFTLKLRIPSDPDLHECSYCAVAREGEVQRQPMPWRRVPARGARELEVRLRRLVLLGVEPNAEELWREVAAVS